MHKLFIIMLTNYGQANMNSDVYIPCTTIYKTDSKAITTKGNRPRPQGNPWDPTGRFDSTFIQSY